MFNVGLKIKDKSEILSMTEGVRKYFTVINKESINPLKSLVRKKVINVLGFSNKDVVSRDGKPAIVIENKEEFGVFSTKDKLVQLARGAGMSYNKNTKYNAEVLRVYSK